MTLPEVDVAVAVDVALGVSIAGTTNAVILAACVVKETNRTSGKAVAIQDFMITMITLQLFYGTVVDWTIAITTFRGGSSVLSVNYNALSYFLRGVIEKRLEISINY